jgi:hypothetical protein
MVEEIQDKILHFWNGSSFFINRWQHLPTDDVVRVRHQHVQAES